MWKQVWTCLHLNAWGEIIRGESFFLFFNFLNVFGLFVVKIFKSARRGKGNFKVRWSEVLGEWPEKKNIGEKLESKIFKLEPTDRLLGDNMDAGKSSKIFIFYFI